VVYPIHSPHPTSHILTGIYVQSPNSYLRRYVLRHITYIKYIFMSKSNFLWRHWIRIRMDPHWFGSLDLDLDPHWGKTLDPNPDPHWNQCGSKGLLAKQIIISFWGFSRWPRLFFTPKLSWKYPIMCFTRIKNLQCRIHVIIIKIVKYFYKILSFDFFVRCCFCAGTEEV
jgi:hypothetical protein